MADCERTIRILPEAGPEEMAQSASYADNRCEPSDFRWKHPHAPEGMGKTFTGSKLGIHATAPDFEFDGSFDVDASRKANASE